MELRTYTGLWNMERRLYRLNDITLPGAPTYKQIGVFVLVAVPWTLAIVTVGISPISPWGLPLWLGPILGITYFANRPLIESKTGIQLFISNARFITESKVYTSLHSFSAPKVVAVRGLVWRSR
jgi:hypothetical protein